MKKLLFALLFVFFATLPAVQAQKLINVGIMAGANFSNIPTSTASVKSNYIPGFIGGAWGRVNIKKFMIQPELAFSMKGGNVKFNPGDGSPEQSVDIRFNNVDVGVIGGYKILDLKLVQFRVMAGPVASFMVGTMGDMKKMFQNAGNVNSIESTKDFFNGTQWNYQVGLGLDVWKLGLDVRYEGSFNDLRSDASKAVTTTVNGVETGVFTNPIRNSLFRITLCYKFL